MAASPWLVVGDVVLLAVLGLGTAWRTVGGSEADAEADAADVADDDPEPTAHGRTRDGLTDFAGMPGGC